MLVVEQGLQKAVRLLTQAAMTLSSSLWGTVRACMCHPLGMLCGLPQQPPGSIVQHQPVCLASSQQQPGQRLFTEFCRDVLEGEAEGMFLDGARIHLACCAPREQMELVRICREGAATRHVDLLPAVTHIVVSLARLPSSVRAS